MAENSKDKRPTLAELVTQEIVALHDAQARKHDCPGYDCATCSLHALQYRIEEIIGTAIPAAKEHA